MFSYVIAHARTVTLASLAEAFHYSTPYCSKVLREAAGMAFSQVLMRAWIQKGMALLTSTQLSTAEIAGQVGYKNPETFIRAFERVCGCTPSQYRKEGVGRMLIQSQSAWCFESLRGPAATQ